MRTRLLLSLMWRESRGAGRRFLFFIGCLAIGVAAIVCVAGITATLDQQIRSEARQLLAADLMVRGLRPLPVELDEFIEHRPDLQATKVRELITVAARSPLGGVPGRSQVVELKVLSGIYPFYGTLECEPRRPIGELLDGGSVVVAPDLLQRLELRPDEEVKIGGVPFRIAGTVLREPDRVATPFSLGPRIFMAAEDFERTELEQLGSRIVYRLLIKITHSYDQRDLESLTAELKGIVGEAGPYRVETYIDTQEEMRRALQRAASYLGLVALLSLLLGGLGVAQTTRAWLASRMDDIATLRCLGLSPASVLRLFLGQAAVLGLTGSIIGVVMGIAAQAAMPYLFSDLLAASETRLWQPMAWIRGLSLGLGVALLFSLRTLLTVRRVPPLRVLRKDVEPLPVNAAANLLLSGLVMAGIWTIAAVQATSPWRGLQFAAGIATAALLLAGCALAATRLLAPAARHIRSVWLAQGLLALARPGAATLAAVISLGVGVLLIVGLQLVKNLLSEELRHDLPAESPTAFFINIQPFQWPEVEALLENAGASRIESVPFVTARLRSIDGREVATLASEGSDGDRRWALTREQRLTFMSELPADNRVIAGSLWQVPGVPEVSVEEEFAHELGAELGSELRFDIQGVPVDLRVTSLRSVEWRSFGINFFLVVEPGVLEEAPQQRVATARLPAGQEQSIQDRLADQFPNITVLRIREILERIATVLGYMARGVGFVGGFTVVAGILILAGGVSADSVRRRKQIALLKTLGMTQREVAGMLAIEFAVVGTIAGVIGSSGGSLLAWVVLTRGLELDWHLRPITLLAAVLVALLLTAATGVVATLPALRQRPAEILRGE